MKDFTGRMFTVLFLTVLATVLLGPPVSVSADTDIILSDGETVYVSIYSNVYSGPREKPFQLAAMLNIRNTDQKHAITILQIDYHDNNGKKIDQYIEKLLEIGPLASKYFYIKEYDKRGGPGANFIVKWKAETKVNQPIIEAVMLGLASGQGLSFICPGQIIKEWD
jgi:hypothetical protein